MVADLAYHWTTLDAAKAILDSGMWEAGSATLNPAYRFCKGDPNEPQVCLVFQSQGFVRRENQTVPWAEWEVISSADIDLYGERFVCFATRTRKAQKQLERVVLDIFGDPYLFPVRRVHPLRGLLKGNQ